MFRRRRREDADQAGRASGTEQDELDDEFAEPDEDLLEDPEPR